MSVDLGNTYDDYSELIDQLYKFCANRERAQCDNDNFRLTSEALRMVCYELGKERTFVARGSAPKAKTNKAIDTMADVMKAYNDLNREELELDRRDVDADVLANARRRPGRKD